MCFGWFWIILFVVFVCDWVGMIVWCGLEGWCWIGLGGFVFVLFVGDWGVGFLVGCGWGYLWVVFSNGIEVMLLMSVGGGGSKWLDWLVRLMLMSYCLNFGVGGWFSVLW